MAFLAAAASEAYEIAQGLYGMAQGIGESLAIAEEATFANTFTARNVAGGAVIAGGIALPGIVNSMKTIGKRKKLGISDKDANSGSNKKLRTSDNPGKGGGVPPARDSAAKQMPTAAGKGTDGGEVPVMPVPRNISKVVPNYFTINLPYEEKIVTNASVYTLTNSLPVLRIRLNSIYDPIVGTASDTQPQGRDLWAGHFKYYRVLGANVTFTLLTTQEAAKLDTAPTPDDFPADRGIFVYGYELCDQDQTICDKLDSFLCAKHCKRAMMGPAVVDRVWNGTTTDTHLRAPARGTLSYNYSPNDWNFHVREVGTEERWTPILQNPSVDHDLVIRMFHLDNTAPDDRTSSLMVLVNINYTVQFMEEKEVAYKTRDGSGANYVSENTTQTDD